MDNYDGVRPTEEDLEEMREQMRQEEYARRPARIEDIRLNPSKHLHDFDGLFLCSTIDNAVDSYLVDLHMECFAAVGRPRCDVVDGPCACGAYHKQDSFLSEGTNYPPA